MRAGGVESRKHVWQELEYSLLVFRFAERLARIYEAYRLVLL